MIALRALEFPDIAEDSNKRASAQLARKAEPTMKHNATLNERKPRA